MARLYLISFFCALITFTFTFAAPAPYPKRHGAKTSGLGVPVSNAQASDIIANRYIVVYNKNATDNMVEMHQTSVMTALRKRGVNTRGLDGRTLSAHMDSFSMSGWRGMSLDAEDAMMLEIAACSEVAYVEADTIVRTNALVQQSTAPAGLKRISHSAVGTGTAYVFDNSSGAGMVAYVVDTGIRTTHSEFAGRATFGANFVNNVNTDENGHGSHVAGTIGGNTFGVAKAVSLVAVKVLDKDGAGTNSAVINGLNFVSTDAAQRKLSGKAVMNISIGGSKSAALNSAIAALTKGGVTVVAAAGNENQDAGNTSPASAPSAITVGAIDSATDARASFSNFGTSLDVFAPGVKVQSVGITSDTATAVLSGTSMASPHVAGLAAYLMGLDSTLTTPDLVSAKIKSLAASTGAKAGNAGTGSPTLIAYNGDGF